MSSIFNTREVMPEAKAIAPWSVIRRSTAFASSVLVLSVVALSLFASTNCAFASEERTAPRIAIDKNGAPVPTPQLDIDSPATAAPSELATQTAAATTTLSYPYGVTVDVAGNIYITNLFGGVNKYSVTNIQQKVGTITSGLSFPAAVAVDINNNIYVANNGSNNITVYNSSFQLIKTITDSTLQNPMSMYIDSSDDIWILDAQGTVHLYLFDGTPISSVHTGGTCIGPWGPDVTVWGIANGQGGYIEDIQNAGQAVHDGVSFPNYFPTGSPYAGGEAQDWYGQQYVTDILHNQVQIWNSSSSYMIGLINTPATPYGIAVDSRHSRILVVATTLNEVLVYSSVAPFNFLGTIR